MTDSIHGHEVMHLMLELGGTFTEASLQAAMATRFGADARYHTCSAEGMDAEALIAFLKAKGKFTSQPQGFQTSEERICQH